MCLKLCTEFSSPAALTAFSQKKLILHTKMFDYLNQLTLHQEHVCATFILNTILKSDKIQSQVRVVNVLANNCSSVTPFHLAHLERIWKNSTVKYNS